MLHDVLKRTFKFILSWKNINSHSIFDNSCHGGNFNLSINLGKPSKKV